MSTAKLEVYCKYSVHRSGLVKSLYMNDYGYRPLLIVYDEIRIIYILGIYFKF